MPSTSEGTIADTADRLFFAIADGDMAAVDRLRSNDVAVWRTESGRGPARTDGKARTLRVIDWFITATAERHYEILDRKLFDRGFVRQHVLHAAGRAGKPIHMRVCIVIKVDADGLINRINEYSDPAEIAPLIESR